MFSELNPYIPFILIVVIYGCGTYRSAEELAAVPSAVSISVSRDGETDDRSEAAAGYIAAGPEEKTEGPLILNAIRDTETGEMIATDIIEASRVVARFRNVAERQGRVRLEFEITVPGDIRNQDIQLRITPRMNWNGKSADLEKVYVTGKNYRRRQLKGYEKYEEFLNSIVTDSTVFIRKDQLEQFISRHFPDTYAMKADSAIYEESQRKNLFGVDIRTAVEHYTREMAKRRNRKKIDGKDAAFRKYVTTPLDLPSVRLDTVIADFSGNFRYLYVQDLDAEPGMRKIDVGMNIGIFEDGRCLLEKESPSGITFYVSSLSSLVDGTPRYKSVILRRIVSDYTEAFLDFEKGSSELDVTEECNASELARIGRAFDDILSRKDLVADSIVIVASCSPEGSLKFNSELAAARAAALMDHVGPLIPDTLDRGRIVLRSVPENWPHFTAIVRSDSSITEAVRNGILDIVGSVKDRDKAEELLSSMEIYRYLREKIYPKLRTVSFRFHMRRPDMKKDTVHTTELDTVYMNGLAAMKEMDYKRAATLLMPYRDYNAALALASAGYDDAALEILSGYGGGDAKAEYLKALIYSRNGDVDRAVKAFISSVSLDPGMRHRANLDPEMSRIAEMPDFNETHF